MRSDYKEAVLTLFFDGHIDSVNSPEVEEEAKALVAKFTPDSLIIDAQKLEYISSAGLRVILKLRKDFSSMRVINVSLSIYEIFDMTGFTEIVPVEKAMRTYDVSGCEVIGEGANGTVYRVARDTIVKVYKDANSIDDIKRERELSRTAFVLGIPTAIPYDVVRVGDTYGSVFELLNAKSFDELLIEDEGKLDFVVKKSVDIMHIIHSTIAPEYLPHQRETALKWVGEVTGYFTGEQLSKLKGMIEALPEEGMMVHGDLHIKNIMQQNDETLLIDMDTLCTGHPIYELAFMYNAYKGFGIDDPEVIRNFLKISPELAYDLWRKTISAYLDTNDDIKLNEVEDKASVIGLLRVMRRAIRIGQKKAEEDKSLISACHDKITDLLDKYDTLEY